MDAKYDAADLPKIVEENCSHLKSSLLKLCYHALYRVVDNVSRKAG